MASTLLVLHYVLCVGGTRLGVSGLLLALQYYLGQKHCINSVIARFEFAEEPLQAGGQEPVKFWGFKQHT